MRLNGNTAVLGDCADPSQDVIEIDGARLSKAPEPVYLMLNKPRGFVTTMSDEQGRRTVCELVADCGVRVYPVGRLDLNSEGLLLMTNDGDFANRVMHPSHEVEKTYLAWVNRFSPEKLEFLRDLRVLDGEAIAPAKLRLIWAKDESALLELRIHEGKNRQVRRMCAAVGLNVTRLRRIGEGSLKLGDLPTGKWRFLTADEVAVFQNM